MQGETSGKEEHSRRFCIETFGAGVLFPSGKKKKEATTSNFCPQVLKNIHSATLTPQRLNKFTPKKLFIPFEEQLTLKQCASQS